ncbi:MAG: tetratricopeptide repeat protein, partial [Bacteroidota bacterium]
LLMGKSHFYKQDYFLAKEAFEYIIKEYNKDPIKFNAMIWLARTYNELKQYDKALALLENAEGDKDFPRKLKKDLYSTFADYYLKQKQYQDAIPKLVYVTQKETKKSRRARYLYILAQIYQKYDQSQSASNMYRQVIKLNPPYEMAFNAKINRATSFDITHGDSREIKKQLNKMLRDDKNIDYKDQIFFALANIEYKEKNVDKAVELYKKSATASTSNNDQKSLSFLALGDIYFSRPDYKNAQVYYDSTIAFLNTEYPDYEKIYLKSKNLNELMEHLNIVNTEDSLQRVANMNEKERNKLIDDIIQKVREEEERIKREQMDQQANSAFYNQNLDRVNQYNTDQGGKWYFYNPAALSFGRSQFIKKWGNRKLEDNWRRKNKAVVLITQEEDPDDAEADSSKKMLDNKSREYYLQDLPLNDSLMALSHDRIAGGLFKAGGVYKEKLLDFPKAIETYEELNKRYPDNIYKLNSYYQLYKLGVLTNDKPRQDKYKNLIVSGYPNSNYANSLTNPNYLKEIDEKEKEIQLLYSETYRHYQKRNYFKVIENCNKADSLISENPILAKFSLLKALSIGSIRDLSNFRKALRYVINTFPETDEKITAETLYLKVSSPDFAFADSGLIAYNGNAFYNIEETEDPLAKDTATENIVTTNVNLDEIYSYDENSEHFYVMVVNNRADVNRLKFNIISYNVDYFSMFDFNVSVVDLDDNNKIVSVKMLDNKRQAMAYFSRLSKDINDLFQNLTKTEYRHFVITPANYSVLFDNKNVDQYLQYFTIKYKNN